MGRLHLRDRLGISKIQFVLLVETVIRRVFLAKLQNTGPLIYISLNHKGVCCAILRSLKIFTHVKQVVRGGPAFCSLRSLASGTPATILNCEHLVSPFHCSHSALGNGVLSVKVMFVQDQILYFQWWNCTISSILIASQRNIT